jgi:hypothetical protein
MMPRVLSSPSRRARPGCEFLERRCLLSAVPPLGPIAHAAPLIADLTGDGVPDLTSITADGRILFRQGLADGTFAPAQALNGPADPACDLTVVGGPGGALLAALPDSPRDQALLLYAWSRGSGALVQRPGLILPAGCAPVALAGGDLDGNGQGGLVVLDGAGGQALVYRRHGTTFSAPLALNVGSGLSTVALANLAGDGRLDLAVTGPLAGLSVWVNNPSGFSAQMLPLPRAAAFIAGPDQPWLTTGNLEDSRKDDLVVLDNGTARVLHVEADGPESVESLGQFSVPPTATAAVLGTCSSGTKWVAVLDPAAGQVLAWRAAAPDQWDYLGAIDVGRSATGLSLEHLGYEGRVRDAVLVSLASGDVLRLVSNDDATFTPSQSLAGGISVAVEDLGSGKKPVFVYAYPGLDRVAEDLAGRDTVIGDAGAGMAAPAAVRLADLNGDGIDDLIVCNSGGDNVLVYPGLGGGRFGPELDGGKGFATGTCPVDATVLSRPGQAPELLVADEGSDDVTVLQAQRTASGTWTLVEGPRLRVGQAPVAVTVGDLGGPGLTDLVVTNSGDNTVSILTGLGQGRFDDRSPRILPVGVEPRLSLLGDFTGDGRLDLVTLNTGSNNLTFYKDVDEASSRPQTIATGGLGPVAALVLHVHGRAEDLVVANYIDGRLSLLEGGPAGLTLAEVQDQPGAHPMALVPAPGAGLTSVYVADQGQATVTLVQFDDVVQSTPSAPTGGPVALLLEERTEAPVLLPEGGPVIDLQPLAPAMVDLVPTLVIGAGGDRSAGGKLGGPAGPCVPGGTNQELPAPPGPESATLVDDQASVHRFVLGADEAAPPRLGPDGAQPGPLLPLDEGPAAKPQPPARPQHPALPEVGVQLELPAPGPVVLRPEAIAPCEVEQGAWRWAVQALALWGLSWGRDDGERRKGWRRE